MIDDELRDAMRDHTDRMHSTPPSWDRIAERAAPRRLTFVRRNPVWGLAVAAVALFVVLALALLPDDDDGDRDLKVVSPDPTSEPSPSLRDPEPTTTTTAAPTTTTAAPTTTTAAAPVNPASVGGIYPDSDALRAKGSAPFMDPTATARAFVADYVGMINPVMGDFKALPPANGRRRGEVLVYANFNRMTPNVVSVVEVTPGGPWTVTGCVAQDIKVESPAAGAAARSPVAVAGRARTYEGTVNVYVREEGSRPGQYLGEGFVTAASDVMTPFSGEITFRRPTRSAGSLLFIEHSAENGAPVFVTAVRITFPR